MKQLADELKNNLYSYHLRLSLLLKSSLHVIFMCFNYFNFAWI
jgi:hypothetical protein